MSAESFESKMEDIKPEALPDKATDMELVLFLSKHIDSPCEVEVEPGVKENIRHFYIKQARKIIDRLENPYAKDLLEQKNKEYE